VCPSFPVAWCKTPFEYSNNEAAIISLFEFWMDQNANPCVTFS
jgi:hypothetical protein